MGWEGELEELGWLNMFYVCQGSCLCGTASNKGKVIYCYGDLAPRPGELFNEDNETSSRTTSRDLLVAQLGVWVFGLLALLIVLVLINKSISSLRQHIKKVTEQLPWHHDDDDISVHSTSSPHIRHKDTTLESMVQEEEGFDGDGMLSDEDKLDSPDTPLSLNIRGREGGGKAGKDNALRTLRVGRKDRKKAGDGLRGKNVTEAFRVKEKDLKRTGK